MHKKINYLISVFVLSFFFIFLSFPLKTMATQYTILAPEDEVPDGTLTIPISELGAYDIIDDSFGPESTVGEYVWIAPVGDGTTATTRTTKKEKEEKEYPYKACLSGGCNEGQCVTRYSTDPNRPNECLTTDDCINGGIIPPPPPPPSTTTTTSPTTTTTTSSTTTTTTTSPPPPPKCQIFKFSINGKTNEDRNPLYVWVDSSIKGYISVNDSCTTCTVESDDTWGNPPKIYTITSISTYINETFEIFTSGAYSFTVTCQGSDPDDIVVDNFSLETVKVLNLPWWQEIIPVLQGFLRGIWK